RIFGKSEFCPADYWDPMNEAECDRVLGHPVDTRFYNEDDAGGGYYSLWHAGARRFWTREADELEDQEQSSSLLSNTSWNLRNPSLGPTERMFWAPGGVHSKVSDTNYWTIGGCFQFREYANEIAYNHKTFTKKRYKGTMDPEFEYAVYPQHEWM
ncbi:unnamed protein product, partial [Amoebophrya sp. A25]